MKPVPTSAEFRSPREFALNVVRRLHEAGYRALWAGGCVRDLLLNLVPADYDVATSATPDQVRSLFGHRRTLAVGASFGVIVVLGRPEEGQIEVATFRTEGPYRDGRRPERVAFSTPEEDALRRDFTINGLFYDPLCDEVLDYVGGRADLERRVLRAIGDPTERFREDKLRMLRGVRLAARFDYALDPETANAIAAHAADILVVSQERIAQELRKMLEHPRRLSAITLARDLGLLEHILPEARGGLCFARLARLENPSFALALAALVAGEGDPDALPARARDACRRLKLSNEIVERTGWLVDQFHKTGEVATWSLARVKRLLNHAGAGELIDLLRADALAREVQPVNAHALDEWRSRLSPSEIDPPQFLNGNDLAALGVPPGPSLGRALNALRDAQLNEEIPTTEAAREWVRQWLVTPRAD